MTGLCALCLTALLAALVRLAESVGPVVRCEPCDVGALVQCKPLPRDCAERVREPGCGCCLTCALVEGQACGVYTGRCGAGLTCQQRPGETKPLQALLDGRGVCLKKLSSALVGECQWTHCRQTLVLHLFRFDACASARSVCPPLGPPPEDTALLHSKLGMIQKEQSKKSQSYKVESVSGGVHTDVHNFSLESKMEAEYGPCRREIESVLKNLKISNVLNPRFFRIPNCDRKGFYKKKQCRPSKGRRRGYCWCVDKYGQPLPGYESKEQGQVHCYSMEKK
uniref:Insulin-like growth factor-binding protein 3 n=1 Tax=Electrophorus electricus TaxID=8005 RepID=A0AAY5EIF6_ELEEL